MNQVRYINPSLLDQLFHWQIVDIRSRQERRDEHTGFIPGSLSIHDPEEIIAHAYTTPVALYCLTGKRSSTLLQQLPSTLNPIFAVEGGLALWQGLALPVAGLGIARLDGSSVPAINLYQQLRDSFTAQLNQTLHEAGEHGVNPLELLASCFELAQCRPHESDLLSWERVLDEAAAIARRYGTPSHITSSNLDLFLRLLHTPSQSAVSLPLEQNQHTIR